MYNEPKSLKTLIVELLGRRFPLGAGEIRLLTRKRNQIPFSLQAIHKALGELQESGTVIKDKHTYELNPSYISKVDQWVNSTKFNYFSKDNPFSVKPGQKKILPGGSLAEMDMLWNKILEVKMFEFPKQSVIYAQRVPHAFFNLAHMGEETKIVALILKQCKAFYTLVNDTSPLDQWIAKLYEGKRLYYAMQKAGGERDHHFSVLGPYIIETWYPRDIAATLDRLFTEPSSLSELATTDLIALLNTSFKGNVILEHNAKKAERMLKSIKAAFKN
ncbi:MAG: hypothetical protein Q7K44_03155 [Candidatus Liptonbacteria bacterium]|nr:hypothetical protein [Candidatus Liptonbacteria bacterium]